MSRESSERNVYIIPDGVTIVEEQPARFAESTGPSAQANGAIITTVNEVLLSNGDTTFKCVHPNAKPCTSGDNGQPYMAKTVRSVTAHQRSHGAQTLLNKTAKEMEHLRAKEAQEFTNRSNGMKQANARRRELQAEAEKTPLDAATTRLQVAKANLSDAQKTYDEALVVFVQVARRYEKNATPAKPTPIPEDIALKAEKWDKYIEFQKLINN